MWLSARWAGAFTPLLVAWVMGLVGWRHAFEIFGCLGVVWPRCFSCGSATTRCRTPN